MEALKRSLSSLLGSVIVGPMLKAGDITIHFLNDGLWWDDGGAQFGIVPREIWQREKQPNERGRITMSLTCPLIVTRSELIVVDTGIGNRLSAREQQFFTPQRGSGLTGQLRALGYTREDVTHVVLSHLHFDHLGGVIDKGGRRHDHASFSQRPCGCATSGVGVGNPAVGRTPCRGLPTRPGMPGARLRTLTSSTVIQH